MKTIKLTKGMEALVDDEDFELLSKWKWCATFGSRDRKWYAIRRERRDGPAIRMHRYLMGLGVWDSDKRVVDHLNGNSLDNRRENLEVVTQEENMNRVANWQRKKVEVAPSL